MSSERERPADRELAAIFLRNLLETIAVLSDREFQETAWVRREIPKTNSITDFVEAVAVFEDNYIWLFTDDFWRNTELSQQQVDAVKHFNELLDGWLSSPEHGADDATRLMGPYWIEITESAARLLAELQSVPGFEMPNLWSW